MKIPALLARQGLGASGVSGPLHCPTEADLEAAAAAFSRLLEPGDVCLLHGEMGSGKTCFARGAVLALGGDPRHFSSPTFSLVNTYPLPGAVLHHVDLYRLESLSERDDLGQEEWLRPRRGYAFVEWAERLGPLRPERGWAVHIAVRPDGREVRLARIDRTGKESP